MATDSRFGKAKFYEIALSRDKIQCDAIIAIAQAGWLRSIIKDMALMSAAARAVIFCAWDKELSVGFGADGAVNGLEKGWPACARVIFRIRGEKR